MFFHKRGQEYSFVGMIEWLIVHLVEVYVFNLSLYFEMHMHNNY